MNLSLEQIKSITLGAEEVTAENDGIHFYRFTKEQRDLFVSRNVQFSQHLATAGVKMRFLTNSNSLYLKFLTSEGSARAFFSFDIIVNGEFFDSINNFYSIVTPIFPQNTQPHGEYEKEFTLPEGEKEICIHLPWSACCVLKEFTLDDGASLVPVKPKKKIICYGDSITHGWDALFPSNRYTAKLADYLDAEEFNKAVGGGGFFPELIETKEDFVPEYITAAYGTNDWSCLTYEKFEAYCNYFYKNLGEIYKNSKVYAISPIWRKDWQGKREFGDFLATADIIEAAVKNYDNITFIRGFNLLEHDENLYRELTLHPNDDGFAQYFESLKKFIK